MKNFPNVKVVLKVLFFLEVVQIYYIFASDKLNNKDYGTRR